MTEFVSLPTREKLSLSPDQFTEPSAASLLRTPRTGRYTGVVSEGVCPACGGAEIQNFLAQAVSLVGIDIDEISHNWLHASRSIPLRPGATFVFCVDKRIGGVGVLRIRGVHRTLSASAGIHPPKLAFIFLTDC